MTTPPNNPSSPDKHENGASVASGNVSTRPAPARVAGDASSRSAAPTHRGDEAAVTSRAPADAARAVGEPCSAKALECLATIEKSVSQLRRELGAPAAASTSVQEPGSGHSSGSKQRTGSIPGMTL